MDGGDGHTARAGRGAGWFQTDGWYTLPVVVLFATVERGRRRVKACLPPPSHQPQTSGLSWKTIIDFSHLSFGSPIVVIYPIVLFPDDCPFKAGAGGGLFVRIPSAQTLATMGRKSEVWEERGWTFHHSISAIALWPGCCHSGSVVWLGLVPPLESQSSPPCLSSFQSPLPEPCRWCLGVCSGLSLTQAASQLLFSTVLPHF